MSLFFPGFSLSSYLTDKGIANDTIPLDRHAISQLLHDTALAPYMMDEVCDQTVIPYYPNDKGWNKGRIWFMLFFKQKVSVYAIILSQHTKTGQYLLH